jgi:diketogulonate reductase-like aldo/keto reductase
LTDGAELVSFDPDSGQRRPPQHPDAVILPWLGFGTYKLGNAALPALRQALACGYRSVDTAFIYGGETTEQLVGQALHEATLVSRQHVFVTTKHWRKYHGYEPALQCLKLSLQRLQLEYIDLWLMHWPGPAWTTMHRHKDVCQKDPWHCAATTADDLVKLRAETWRAMEEAVRRRQVRAIGVSNMTVRHLEQLRKTAQLWPPAVNQVELQ